MCLSFEKSLRKKFGDQKVHSQVLWRKKVSKGVCQVGWSPRHPISEGQEVKLLTCEFPYFNLCMLCAHRKNLTAKGKTADLCVAVLNMLPRTKRSKHQKFQLYCEFLFFN